MRNAMVANSTFPNRFSHDLMAGKVEQVFCGPLFRLQNLTTTCDTTLRVESWEDTEMVILQAKKTCQRDHTVCVDIDTEFPADDSYFDTQLLRANMCVSQIFTPSAGALNVVMHIRRGDVTGVDKYRARWAYNRAYLDLISMLRTELNRHVLNFTIITEGGSNISAIQDADGSWSPFTDSSHLGGIHLGPTDPIDSFLTMCDADILITGLSSFSYLAGVLCQPPLTLGMPLWQRFDLIQDSVVLEVERDAYGSVTGVLGVPGDIAAKFI
ncbi:hypothetical protein M9435_006760 [Picochlorum sp. BPE23]|nr:hypothetical protein M9435_006760 [Picochlorum sp. BPE23]